MATVLGFGSSLILTLVAPDWYGLAYWLSWSGLICLFIFHRGIE